MYVWYRVVAYVCVYVCVCVFVCMYVCMCVCVCVSCLFYLFLCPVGMCEVVVDVGFLFDSFNPCAFQLHSADCVFVWVQNTKPTDDDFAFLASADLLGR